MFKVLKDVNLEKVSGIEEILKKVYIIYIYILYSKSIYLILLIYPSSPGRMLIKLLDNKIVRQFCKFPIEDGNLSISLFLQSKYKSE